ncbi:MAG: virulence protein E [Bacteroidales bacterium]|nr:virulence protein E [Candidatus Equimonas faecalis]
MVYAGKNIQSSSDALVKMPLDYLHNSIRNPKPEIAALIRQLRMVRLLDAKRYATLKRQLPYIVCAAFNPSFRKTENFCYTEHLIIDIDHISDKDIDIHQLRQRLAADTRVAMMFLSPSGDGLKLLFSLKEKCSDSGVYAIFYKVFARELALLYGIEQVIDSRTCDVTRACFVSIDPEIYFNPNAEPVDINEYINQDNTHALFEIKHQIEQEEKQQQAQHLAEPTIPASHDPDAETMDQIRNLIGSKRSQVQAKKEVWVPEELNDIMPSLKEYIEEQGITLYETINIQYAKKLRFRLGNKTAEINLFYGKHGFSVVQSPRSGTSPDLNQVMADLILLFLDEHH